MIHKYENRLQIWIIRPLKQRLPLARAVLSFFGARSGARRAEPPIAGEDLTGVPRKGPPPGDLDFIDAREAPPNPVATVPLKPAPHVWIARRDRDPTILPPLLQTQPRFDAK